MKKILLCLALLVSLFLVGCNNNTTIDDKNPGGNVNQGNEEVEKDNSTVVVYESTDFSEKAGYKINLGDTLKDVTYDSIFLANNSSAQLDLIFPDGSIGTLLVDPTGTPRLTEPDDATLVGDIKVSIKIGADGIIVYEWIKDNYDFIYSVGKDLKDSQTLTNLVNDITIELAEK